MRFTGKLCPIRRNADRRRGAGLVEFCLVFLLFISFVFGFFSISFWLFAKAALHHAAREGVRFAITAKTLPGLAHDDSIKQVVRNNAFGLLSGTGQTDAVIIEYFSADGSGATAVNGAGNIVRVSIRNYVAPRLVSAIIFFLPDSIMLNVSSVDKMEPYPGAPPART
jgi:Flp pilus assembly protein TadG